MLLAPTFYKKVEKQAMIILEKARVNSMPVPIAKIAHASGAVVVKQNLGAEVSGVLLINNKKGTIGVNQTQSEVRQRFTIAHELGHFLLHKEAHKELFVDKDFIVKYRSDKKYTHEERRQESEANAFAAAILMPKKYVFEELRKEKNQALS